jgi:hypothetical protein
MHPSPPVRSPSNLKVVLDLDLDPPEDIGQLGVITCIQLLLLFTPVTFHKPFF